jgi:putative heme-binding domain-containing protein
MFLSNQRSAVWSCTALVFIIALAAHLADCRAQTPSPQAYEDLAMRTDGDVERGRELFGRTDRALCVLCHTVDGSSALAGPDLFAIGDKFPRRDLIRSILNPSATIAVGYGATSITRKSGDPVIGVIKQATDAWVELKGADGKAVRVETADIASQSILPDSLMPAGLYQALSLEEFANLIAYLEHLRQPQHSGDNAANTLDDVPRARKAVAFSPLFSSIRFDHPVWMSEMPDRPGAFPGPRTFRTYLDG